MKPRVLFPLAATFSTCLFQERLLVSVTPRYLLSSSTARVWPCSCSFTSKLFGFRNGYLSCLVYDSTTYCLNGKILPHDAF